MNKDGRMENLNGEKDNEEGMEILNGGKDKEE